MCQIAGINYEEEKKGKTDAPKDNKDNKDVSKEVHKMM